MIIPWSLDEVEGGPGYTHPAVGEVYKETAYGLAGISGESRSQDANGQYIRVAGGGGTNTVDDARRDRRDARRRHAAADRRRDAVPGRLGEDAVQARGAVREPGHAGPAVGRRPGPDEQQRSRHGRRPRRAARPARSSTPRTRSSTSSTAIARATKADEKTKPLENDLDKSVKSFYREFGD